MRLADTGWPKPFEDVTESVVETRVIVDPL
jgi:hypothetical protein